MGRGSVTALRGLLSVTIVAALVGGAPGPAHADPPPATFLPQTKYVTAAGPTWLAIADFNADGHEDLVSSNTTASNVSVRLGGAGGELGPRTDVGTGLNPLAVTTADLNGDTFVDIVTANEQAGTVSVLLGDGDGGFAAHAEPPGWCRPVVGRRR